MRSSGSTSVDDDLAAGRRREPDEARDLDVVRADPDSRPPPSSRATVDVEDVRSDPLDLGADRDEEAAEILDVRLARGVAEHRLALGEHGRHDRVLRSHDGRLVEVHARRRAARRPRARRRRRCGRRRRERRTRARACRGVAGRSRRHPEAAPSPVRSARASGPASRNDARISRASSASRSVLPMPPGSTRTSFEPVHSTSAPRSASSSTIVSTSRMRGTFDSRTSSDASAHAARIGSAPFLLPDARTVPESGRPPSMTKDCIARAMLLAVFTCSFRLFGEIGRSASLGIEPAGSKPSTCA